MNDDANQINADSYRTDNYKAATSESFNPLIHNVLKWSDTL